MKTVGNEPHKKLAANKNNFVRHKKNEVSTGIEVDEAFDKCFDLLSNLYGVDTYAIAEQHNLL